jgi:putative spermidine/putrescine transport system substrate-binding protein
MANCFHLPGQADESFPSEKRHYEEKGDCPMKNYTRIILSILATAAILSMLAAQCAAPITLETVVETVVVKEEVVKEVEVVITATPEAVAERPTQITIVDTNSGANFQWYWQNQVIPAIEDQLGIKVDYVVSSESESIERMKAWEPGQGDAHLLFVKPETIPKALGEGIELETLYPDKLDVIPNMEKNPKAYLETVLGTPIDGKGALYWRSQYALIYNSEYIKDPPTSWKEFYDRREEWEGHIGIVRPDAKSGSSYRIPYSFLNAYVDMVDEDGNAIPLEELQQTDEWQEAWSKLQDFYTYAKQPLPAEPPNMFEDFNAGDTWISFYAMDYALWSRHQGTMPPTIKSSFLEEGMAAGSDGYLIVPAGIPEEYKPVVYDVINFLLSDDQQVRLITTMWQYTGTDIWDKIPGVVWDTIPAWEDMEPARLRIGNSEVKEYIKEFGPEELVP